MERSYFEKIKRRYIKNAIWTNDCANGKSREGNLTNYGSCITWAQVLRDMGHKVEESCYQDTNGYIRIPFLKIDGEKIADFEESAGSQLGQQE